MSIKINNKLENFLIDLFEDEGAEGVTNCLSSLFGSFVMTKDGIVISASEDFCELIGYDRLELYGSKVKELITPDEWPTLLARFRDNDQSRYELKLLTKSGCIKTVLVTPKVLHLKDGVLRIAEFLDITVESEVALELQEREMKFRSIFELAAIGIARIKLDGSWLECNQKLCEIVGYSEDELLQLTFKDITHPGDLEKELAYVTQMLADKRKNYSMEKRYVHKLGHMIWINMTLSLVRDSNNEPLYFVSLIEDITELKQARDYLVQSEGRFRAMMESLPLAIYVTTDENRICEYMNKTFTDMLGYTIEDVPSVEAWWPKAFPEVEYREAVSLEWQAKIDAAVDSEIPFEPLDCVVTCKNGTTKYIRFGYVALDTLVYAFGLDITATKEAEAKLVELNSELEHLSFFDALTNISNRRLFDLTLEKEWDRAQRYRTPLSLIMVDIDFFKLYNDYYGHLQGDQALKKVGQVLKKSLHRSVDLLARFGGEEFVILLPDLTIEQAIVIAEKCRTAIVDQQIENTSSPVSDVLSISLGVGSVIPNADSQFSSLIDSADKMLYLAKSNGRNRVEPF